MLHKVPTTKGGYTIIETMISISLFLVVIIYGMGSILNANVLHQKSQDMRSIIDNLSFVMEDMSRSLRTGYTYHCFVSGDAIASSSVAISTPRSCASGWALAFEASGGNSSNSNDQWVYYISSGKLWKATAGPYTAANFIQLTPDEVYISDASNFAVLGAEPTPEDTGQPFVFIRLVGSITSRGVVTPFSLQTTASQRLMDN